MYENDPPEDNLRFPVPRDYYLIGALFSLPICILSGLFGYIISGAVGMVVAVLLGLTFYAFIFELAHLILSFNRASTEAILGAQQALLHAGQEYQLATIKFIEECFTLNSRENELK